MKNERLRLYEIQRANISSFISIIKNNIKDRSEEIYFLFNKNELPTSEFLLKSNIILNIINNLLIESKELYELIKIKYPELY